MRKSQEKIVKILGKIIKEIPGSKSAIFLKKTFNDFEEFLYASQEEFLKSFDGILEGISNGFLLVEFFDDFHWNFNFSCRNARIIFYMVLSGKTYGKICKWKSMLVELEKPSEKFLDESFKKLLKVLMDQLLDRILKELRKIFERMSIGIVVEIIESKWGGIFWVNSRKLPRKYQK